MLSAGQQSNPLTLDHTGVIAVGCNIHDQMITFLYVSDATWLARSAADGSVKFTGLPAGHYSVRPWHPRMRPGKSAQPQSVELADGGSAKLTFQFPLMPDRRPPAAGDVSPY